MLLQQSQAIPIRNLHVHGHLSRVWGGNQHRSRLCGGVALPQCSGQVDAIREPLSGIAGLLQGTSEMYFRFRKLALVEGSFTFQAGAGSHADTNKSTGQKVISQCAAKTAPRLDPLAVSGTEPLAFPAPPPSFPRRFRWTGDQTERIPTTGRRGPPERWRTAITAKIPHRSRTTPSRMSCRPPPLGSQPSRCMPHSLAGSSSSPRR